MEGRVEKRTRLWGSWQLPLQPRTRFFDAVYDRRTRSRKNCIQMKNMPRQE